MFGSIVIKNEPCQEDYTVENDSSIEPQVGNYEFKTFSPKQVKEEIHHWKVVAENPYLSVENVPDYQFNDLLVKPEFVKVEQFASTKIETDAFKNEPFQQYYNINENQPMDKEFKHSFTQEIIENCNEVKKLSHDEITILDVFPKPEESYKFEPIVNKYANQEDLHKNHHHESSKQIKILKPLCRKSEELCLTVHKNVRLLMGLEGDRALRETSCLTGVPYEVVCRLVKYGLTERKIQQKAKKRKL